MQRGVRDLFWVVYRFLDIFGCVEGFDGNFSDEVAKKASPSVLMCEVIELKSVQAEVR